LLFVIRGLFLYHSDCGVVGSAFHGVSRSQYVQGRQKPFTGQEESNMAESRPKKVGIYERSVARASGSLATVIGIIVLLIVLIVLAIIIF
jgi:hypothetical protein